jgi:plasmid stability protein
MGYGRRRKRRKAPGIKPEMRREMVFAMRQAAERFQEAGERIEARDFSLEYLRAGTPERICAAIVMLNIGGHFVPSGGLPELYAPHARYIRELEAEARQILDEKLSGQQRRAATCQALIDAYIAIMQVQAHRTGGRPVRLEGES